MTYIKDMEPGELEVKTKNGIPPYYIQTYILKKKERKKKKQTKHSYNKVHVEEKEGLPECIKNKFKAQS